MHDTIFRFNHDFNFAANCVIVSIFGYMIAFIIVGIIATSIKKLIPYRFWIIGIFTLIFAPLLSAETWLIPEYLLIPIVYSAPTVPDAVRTMIKENPHNLNVPMSVAERYLPN